MNVDYFLKRCVELEQDEYMITYYLQKIIGTSINFNFEQESITSVEIIPQYLAIKKEDIDRYSIKSGSIFDLEYKIIPKDKIIKSLLKHVEPKTIISLENDIEYLTELEYFDSVPNILKAIKEITYRKDEILRNFKSNLERLLDLSNNSEKLNPEFYI